jgi:uncharacterized protein (DUF983 family)
MKVSFEDGGSGGRRADRSARPLGRALARGARGRCPACGGDALFDGFLTIRPVCRVCGEEFHHHRADDLPPYLTILIVGHVVVSGLLLTERLLAPPMWVEAAVWLPLTLLLSLVLLRPLKGAVVALQWALFMHGFGRAPTPFSLPPKAS